MTRSSMRAGSPSGKFCRTRELVIPAQAGIQGLHCKRTLAATFAFMLAIGAATAAEHIAHVEVRRLPPIPVTHASHDLTLQLHTFRGTRWNTHEIMSAYAQSARLLAQCGIAFASAELRVLEAPRRFHYYHTPVSRELLRTVQVRKPAVFFVEDTRNNPAFDAEAIGRVNSANRPELANTVWVAHGTRDLPHALAHELVHVLSDSGGHSTDQGNLMQAETAPQNHRLTVAQCELVRSRGEASGLLKRRH